MRKILHQILSILLFINLVAFFNAANAQVPQGSISGNILTNDEAPGAFVTVKIIGGKSAMADKNGYFQIKQLPAGTYTVQISLLNYQTHTETAVVTPNQNTTLNIKLKLSLKELQEVVVTSSRNKVTNKNSEQVARLPINNLQNPQTYNVVGAELMKQQSIVTLTDAFRNAPGVVPVLYPSGGIGALSRGFSTGIDARNGLQSTTGRSSADLANVERIEFIKGPSGTLFGGAISSFGGVVNLVTKKPQEDFHGSVNLSLGSFALGRVDADINTPLNADKSLLLRVNTAIQKQEGYNERGFYNSAIFAPSLLYKVSDKFSVLFDAELYSVNSIRPSYVRILPASGITSYADIPLDYRKSLLDNDLDAKTTATKFFIEAKYQLSENWTSSTNISYANENVERSYQDYPVWIKRDSVTIDVSKYGPVSNIYTNIQQNFSGKFNTGTIGHTLLLGANVTQYNGRGMSGSTGVIRKLNSNDNNPKVDRTLVDSALTPGSLLNWGQSNTTNYGAYISDVLNFGDRFYAMLSLRYEFIDEKSSGPWAVPYTQGSLSPKIGLVYQPIKDQISIFANYMNGFQNNPPATQPDGSRFVIKPVYAVQYEGGIKAELLDKKINTTLSYYHIGIDNAVRYDLNSFVFQDGKQTSKGFEWDFSAIPTEGMTLLLGYGYNDNRIINAAGLEGNLSSNAPQHIANYWINYQFKHGALKNFGLGAGGSYTGKAYFDDTNLFLLPAYHLLNASAFYENPKIRIGLKLNNIGNEKSWGFWGAPNPTRNFVANMMVKF